MDPESSRSIGTALREARERQQLTLAECVERTRIRRKYLEALENEEFQTLPEPAYARGFLRTYATSLGIDPQRLIDAYDDAVEPEEPGRGHMELRAREAPRAEQRHEPKRRTGTRALLWALVGVVVVVVAAFFASRGVAIEAVAIGGAADYFSR
ncbi:MAG: helix-turn-helix domain-containing protein [Thermoleophilia bacterium]|nr:helix-turn-helix domain-containing protein [Thermoleophilia bacterium]